LNGISAESPDDMEKEWLMTLYVLLFCVLLIILVSVMHQWKLLLLLAFVFVASVFALLWYSDLQKKGVAEREIESVHILYGNEKKGLLNDPEFQRILRKKHGVVIKGNRMERLKLPKEVPYGIDALWPSGGWAALMFRQQHPNLQHKIYNIFSTPIVFCSWPEVTDILIRQGVVEKRKNLYFAADMKKLLKMGNQTWESKRLPQQKGRITVISADPRGDNAGFLTIGLAAVALNDGNKVDEKGISRHLPELRNICNQMISPEISAYTLFNRYIKQGQGAFPLISVCENQIIEFYQTYPKYQDKIRKHVRVLLPEPTVLSEHPFIALTEKGEMLLTALQDPDVQKLAWQKYGFRSGVADIDNDSAILQEIGLSGQIESFTPLPSPEAMEKIIEVLEKNDVE